MASSFVGQCPPAEKFSAHREMCSKVSSIFGMSSSCLTENLNPEREERLLMFGRSKLPTTAFLVIVSLVTSFRFGWADSWGPPPKEHWSNDRQFVLFVSELAWGQSKLVLKERGRNGFRLRWIAFHSTPVQAFITDDGRYIVLRDQWGQVGYGKVLTFFGPDGRVLASYTLEQLLPFDEILEVPTTMSSRW
jgi:hypothetical protein